MTNYSLSAQATAEAPDLLILKVELGFTGVSIGAPQM
jgi:hypothetical protein